MPEIPTDPSLVVKTESYPNGNGASANGHGEHREKEYAYEETDPKILRVLEKIADGESYTAAIWNSSHRRLPDEVNILHDDLLRHLEALHRTGTNGTPAKRLIHEENGTLVIWNDHGAGAENEQIILIPQAAVPIPQQPEPQIALQPEVVQPLTLPEGSPELQRLWTSLDEGENVLRVTRLLDAEGYQDVSSRDYTIRSKQQLLTDVRSVVDALGLSPGQNYYHLEAGELLVYYPVPNGEVKLLFQARIEAVAQPASDEPQTLPEQGGPDIPEPEVSDMSRELEAAIENGQTFIALDGTTLSQVNSMEDLVRTTEAFDQQQGFDGNLHVDREPEPFSFATGEEVQIYAVRSAGSPDEDQGGVIAKMKKTTDGELIFFPNYESYTNDKVILLGSPASVLMYYLSSKPPELERVLQKGNKWADYVYKELSSLKYDTAILRIVYDKTAKTLVLNDDKFINVTTPNPTQVLDEMRPVSHPAPAWVHEFSVLLNSYGDIRAQLTDERLVAIEDQLRDQSRPIHHIRFDEPPAKMTVDIKEYEASVSGFVQYVGEAYKAQLINGVRNEMARKGIEGQGDIVDLYRDVYMEILGRLNKIRNANERPSEKIEKLFEGGKVAQLVLGRVQESQLEKFHRDALRQIERTLLETFTHAVEGYLTQEAQALLAQPPEDEIKELALPFKVKGEEVQVQVERFNLPKWMPFSRREGGESEVTVEGAWIYDTALQFIEEPISRDSLNTITQKIKNFDTLADILEQERRQEWIERQLRTLQSLLPFEEDVRLTNAEVFTGLPADTTDLAEALLEMCNEIGSGTDARVEAQTEQFAELRKLIAEGLDTPGLENPKGVRNTPLIAAILEGDYEEIESICAAKVHENDGQEITLEVIRAMYNGKPQEITRLANAIRIVRKGPTGQRPDIYNGHVRTVQNAMSVLQERAERLSRTRVSGQGTALRDFSRAVWLTLEQNEIPAEKIAKMIPNQRVLLDVLIHCADMYLAQFMQVDGMYTDAQAQVAEVDKNVRLKYFPAPIPQGQQQKVRGPNMDETDIIKFLGELVA